jgi:hypothetical protein
MKRNKILVFDMKVGMEWVPAQQFITSAIRLFKIYSGTEMGQEDGTPDVTVPILHVGPLRDWLDGKTIKEASNGQSELHQTLREGVVIRPLEEQRDDQFGRIIIKQRSPEYLAGSKL